MGLNIEEGQIHSSHLPFGGTGLFSKRQASVPMLFNSLSHTCSLMHTLHLFLPQLTLVYFNKLYIDDRNFMLIPEVLIFKLCLQVDDLCEYPT